MSDWNAEQIAAADLKAGVLNISNTTVTQVQREGFSASSRYSREYGPVSNQYDIDHLVDRQLGGSSTLDNLWPLDLSVNRSLGAQIQNQIQGLPPGTRINRVTIGN
jgi:filamentous hemagglutinin